MTPWKDLGNKFAALLNNALDDAKKEIDRKKAAAVGTVTVEVKGASAMTPADVSAAAPADPHGKMRAANEEIERLRAELRESRAEIDRLCLLADCAIEILGPVEGIPAWRARDHLRAITSSPHRKAFP